MDRWQAVFVCGAVLMGCNPRATTPNRSAPARPPAEPNESIDAVTAEVRARLVGGKGDAALALAERFHRATVERVGPEHAEAAAALLLVGQVHAARGDDESAFQSFRKALPALERSLGADHPLIGQTLTAMAGFAIAAGRAGDATDAAVRAVRILEHAVPPIDLELAAAVTALGHARLALNDASSAAASFRRALEVRERSLGPSHLLVGMSANALGAAEYTLGNEAAAAALYERALPIFEKNLDASLESFSDTAVRLSMARRNDSTKNEAMLRHVLHVVEGKRGRRHAAYVEIASAIYSNLAARQTDDYAAAQMDELGVRARCVPEQACKSTRSPPDTAGKQILPPTRRAEVMRVLAALRPRYGDCFVAARSKNPNIAGIVQLTLDVGASGSVSFVKATSVDLDDETVSCLIETARGAKFDPPSEGHAVIVQPLSVEPRRSAAAPAAR